MIEGFFIFIWYLWEALFQDLEKIWKSYLSNINPARAMTRVS